MYKYQRLREDIRSAIVQGTLQGKLPGERELARHYGANPKTISKALSDLTIEGLLVRRIGQGTFVAKQAPNTPVRSLGHWVVAWLARSGPSYPHHEQAYLQTKKLLQAKGYRLDWLSADPLCNNETADDIIPSSLLRDLAGVICYAFVPSDECFMRLHRYHTPIVIANNRHEVVRTCTVVMDYSRGAFELTEHLIQLGHRRIKLMLGHDLLPAATAAADGYAAALRRYGLDSVPYHQVDGCFDWNAVFDRVPFPTAMVCVGYHALAGALAGAERRGLEIPSAMSLTAVIEPGSPLPGASFVTTYSTDLHRIVEWAAELFLSASSEDTPPHVIVAGQMTHRQSTAPVPSPRRILPMAPSDTCV